MRGGRLAVALCICLITGAGCSHKNGVPGGILPVEKMESVMWDMAQADQYAAIYLAKDSAHINRKAETMRLYEEVFRLHEVTREEFKKSYRYYLDHPVISQLLFDSLIARGVRARSELYDRPGFRPAVEPIRPVVAPGKPGVVVAGRPGVLTPGVVMPGRPGAVTPPGSVMPGRPGAVTPPGKTGAAMRQAQEVKRRRDSLMRVMQMRRDSVRP